MKPDVRDLLYEIYQKKIEPVCFWTLYEESYTENRILTVNIEILKELLRDRSALRVANFCTIDSIVVAFAIRAAFGEKVSRLTGREIVEKSSKKIDARSICMFGASEESRTLAKAKLQKLGATSGQILVEVEPVSLKSTPLYGDGKPLACYFAYGFPKQEEKIDVFRGLNSGCGAILIGVGGAVDYFSGAVRPPPKLIADIGFEWLWRVFQQPRSRIRRVVGVAPFAVRVIVCGVMARKWC